ncbi:MAG: phospholipid carrier-dependent glycosyltransferase [Candidatus Omnitrophica bacterium]|nr:phospholipid carrier-dependent glycosyltransferase [Candidatus Omnitrophota bacterium]
MELIGLTAALAVMTGAGYAVLRAVAPERVSIHNTWEKLAFSYGLGMACVTVQFLVLGLLGAGLNLTLMIVPWVIALSAVTAVRKPEERYTDAGNRRPLPGAGRFMLGILLVQMFSVFVRALVKPIESYDAIVNFAIKSKIMFLENGLRVSDTLFEGIGKGHRDYPLLIPAVQTWVYRFMGAHNDVLVKAVYPLVLVAFMVAVYTVLKRRFDARYGLLFAFILGTMPQIVNYATIGYADLTFTFLVTTSFLMLLEYFRKNEKGALALSALFLGAGMLTKNEGISFLFSTVVVLGFFLYKKRGGGGHAGVMVKHFLLPLGIILVPWVLFKVRMDLPNTDIDLSGMSWARFMENAGHIPFILNKFQQELFQPKKWNIFWIMVTGFSVLRYKRLSNELVRLAGVFLLLNIGIYFCSYMVLTGKDLYFHVNTTMSRFMIHFSGTALVYLALLMRKDIERIPFFRQAPARTGIQGQANRKASE